MNPTITIILAVIALAAGPSCGSSHESPADDAPHEPRALKVERSDEAEPPEPPPPPELPRRGRVMHEVRVGAVDVGRRPRPPEEPAEQEDDLPRSCPRIKGRKPMVYSLGSSSMGGLARILGRQFERWGVKHAKWAKASTGLARPDFHDWPAEVPKLVRKYDPDVFVVVLGTNDHQAVRVGRRWVRPNEDEWEEIYAGRVQRMLEAMSAGRDRWIFWIGPNALDRRSSRTIGSRINAIMKRVVEDFDGPAVYIDVYSEGVRDSGRVRRLFQRPDGGWSKIRGHDGVHLTRRALRWLMAEPVFASLRHCFGVARKGPLPRREVLGPERRVRQGPAGFHAHAETAAVPRSAPEMP